MKKLIIVLISCLLITLSSVSEASRNKTENDKLYYILKESTVQLQIAGTDGNYYGCTGIIIKKDTNSIGILTAQHCVDIAEKIYVDGTYKVSDWIKANTVDVAYLIVNETMRDKSAIKLARTNSSMFASVCSLGYPGQNELFDCGSVVSIGTDNVYSDISIIQGCSGSGVINKYGELIGIMHSNYSYKKTKRGLISIATKISIIRKFLRKNNIFADVVYSIQ